MEKCNTLFNTCKMLFERKELQEYCNHYYCTGYWEKHKSPSFTEIVELHPFWSKEDDSKEVGVH